MQDLRKGALIVYSVLEVDQHARNLLKVLPEGVLVLARLGELEQ